MIKCKYCGCLMEMPKSKWRVLTDEEIRSTFPDGIIRGLVGAWGAVVQCQNPNCNKEMFFREVKIDD